ncbi:MAG: antibiotic biosynthesis monooxygenase [Desulfovibrio sp.]|jgi:quinol monooxygenase YgiN|nr:antibiotic biosynthesis monooxygenase [Desulfovibrio sp.]
MEQDIYAVAYIRVTPEARDGFLRIMKSMIAAGKADQSNKRYELLQDPANPDAFTVIAIWASAEDIHRHEKSREFGELLPLLGSGAVKIHPVRGTRIL